MQPRMPYPTPVAPTPSVTLQKLVIGQENDAAEREADLVAEKVVAGEHLSTVGRRGPATLQRKCAACEEKGEDTVPLARKAHPESAPAGSRIAPAIVYQVLATPGTPLGRDERTFFEPRFGHDFANVRVHADAEAAESAREVNALAYTVGNHVVLGSGQANRRLLAHELAHVVQQTGQTRPALRRQRKTVGGPLDLELDPCIEAADHELCVHHFQEACEKFPGIPGCGFICRTFGCKKPTEPKTQCPPGWRAATSKDYVGQCCKGEIDSAKNCCPPARVAWAEDRCCGEGEVVVDNHCKMSGELPPLPPCPSGERTLLGECCMPPMVSKGLICGLPTTPEPKPSTPDKPAPQLGILWTDQIHFEQDQPGRGAGPVLTPEGAKELESVLSWLRISPDLEVRLIGSASWEGPEAGRKDYNQALATQRVQFVVKALGVLAARVADPIMSDGAESGCQPIGTGRWSCGAKNAPPNTARPEDRIVRVTFARNKLTLPPLKLEMPKSRPGPF